MLSNNSLALSFYPLYSLCFQFFQTSFAFNGSSEKISSPYRSWVHRHLVAEDYFWDQVFKGLVEVGSPFRVQELGLLWGIQSFKTLFADYYNGEGTVVPSRYVLKMVEKEEVAFYNINFVRKTNMHHLFDKWVWTILAQPEMRKQFNDLGIMRATR